MSSKFNKQLLAFLLGLATLTSSAINCLAMKEEKQPTGQHVGFGRCRVQPRSATKLIIMKDGPQITPGAPAISTAAAPAPPPPPPSTGGEETTISSPSGTASISPSESSGVASENLRQTKSAPGPYTAPVWLPSVTGQSRSFTDDLVVPRATAPVFQSPPDMLDARLAGLRLKKQRGCPLTNEDTAEIEAIEFVQRSCRGNRMATLVYGATNERKECCRLLCHCIVGAGNVTTRLLDLIAQNRPLQDADIAPFVQTINGQKYVYLDLHGLPQGRAIAVATCAVQYCLANRATLDLVLGSSHHGERRLHQGLGQAVVEAISERLSVNPYAWITPSGSIIRYDIAGFGEFLLPITAAAVGFDSLESESEQRERRQHEEACTAVRRERDSYRRDVNSLVAQLAEQRGMVRTAQAETARAIQEKQRAQERAARAENGIQRRIVDMKRYSDQSLHAAAQRAQEELERVRREFEQREILIRQEAQEKEQRSRRCDVAAWILGLLDCDGPPPDFDRFTQTIRIALDGNSQLQELFKTDSNFLSIIVSQWNTLIDLGLERNRLWNTDQAGMLRKVFNDFLVRCLA